MRPIESHSDFVSAKLATILVLREEIAPTKGSGSKFSFDISRQELDRWLKNIRSSRSGEWRAHVRRVESVRNETVQGKRYPLWKRTTGAPEGTAETIETRECTRTLPFGLEIQLYWFYTV